MDPNAGGQPPADIQTELANIKDMLQQLMDAQVAMMQALAPPDMSGGGGAPPAGPQGMPPDAGMMPPPGMNGGMDPSMMGLPAAPPPPGMVAQASYEEQHEFSNYIKSITDLLR
jgi:hypothetical protein